MPTRQEQVADAAIRVLGTHGMRQLTHRAVDAEAGLPSGSTSNYFRTRQALIGAVVDRLTALDRVDWQRLTELVRPTTPDELAAALAEFVLLTTGRDRNRTLARYALFLEAAVRPELRGQLTQGSTEIAGWGVAWLHQVGSPDPQRHYPLVLRYLEGALLHQITMPDPHFDPLPGIRLLLRGLIPGPVDRPAQ